MFSGARIELDGSEEEVCVEKLELEVMPKNRKGDP